MARKNRKKRLDTFACPGPFVGVAVVLSVLGLCYVWLGCGQESLGRDLRRLEAERVSIGKRLQNEEYKWALTKSPGNIEKALTRHGIAMTWPRRDQVVHVRDVGAYQRPLADAPGRTLTYVRRERFVMNE